MSDITLKFYNNLQELTDAVRNKNVEGASVLAAQDAQNLSHDGVIALGSPDEANAVATIFINTNMAAAAGVVAAMLLTQLLYKKVDITMALNGALAGLVSITAEPLAPTLGWALAIGAIGGVIVVLTVPLLDKLRIDDVVGAIPVHLFCGIWGTMAVPLTNADTNFAAQATGVISIGIFVAVTSLVLWLALRFTIGIRCSEEEEMMGLDKAEIGVEAYPEFTVR